MSVHRLFVAIRVPTARRVARSRNDSSEVIELRAREPAPEQIATLRSEQAATLSLAELAWCSPSSRIPWCNG